MVASAHAELRRFDRVPDTEDNANSKLGVESVGIFSEHPADDATSREQ